MNAGREVPAGVTPDRGPGQAKDCVSPTASPLPSTGCRSSSASITRPRAWPRPDRLEDATFRAGTANERLGREARRAIAVISGMVAVALVAAAILIASNQKPAVAPKGDFGAIASVEVPRLA